jgi:hypothetical protein
MSGLCSRRTYGISVRPLQLLGPGLHPLASDGRDEEGGICLSLNGKYRTDAYHRKYDVRAVKGDVPEQ